MDNKTYLGHKILLCVILVIGSLISLDGLAQTYKAQFYDPEAKSTEATITFKVVNEGTAKNPSYVWRMEGHALEGGKSLPAFTASTGAKYVHFPNKKINHNAFFNLENIYDICGTGNPITFMQISYLMRSGIYDVDEGDREVGISIELFKGSDYIGQYIIYSTEEKSLGKLNTFERNVIVEAINKLHMLESDSL